jgi:hypothetical protein
MRADSVFNRQPALRHVAQRSDHFAECEAAERLAFGIVVSPSSSDQLSAKMFTRRLSFSRAGANALLEHCRLEARAILQMRWPAVEAIARALDLEDELDGEAVAQLIAKNPPLW